ncbi:MAG: hypothetical protein PHD15_07280 [Clostridia bacterium]|nr:hypothetical protein [Clostridia bacterium]MDD4387532.1 hypothetical protein [Clostridia bacterium]
MRFQTAIILKDDILLGLDTDNHDLLLNRSSINDTFLNAYSNFVRVELLPINNKISLDNLNDWELYVDQDILPNWFIKEYDKQRLIDKMKSTYLNNELFLKTAISVDPMHLENIISNYQDNLTI